MNVALNSKMVQHHFTSPFASPEDDHQRVAMIITDKRGQHKSSGQRIAAIARL